MKHALATAASAYELLRERIALQFPEIDDETLRDSTDGFSNLTETIAAVLRFRREDLALATALKAQLKEMGFRTPRLVPYHCGYYVRCDSPCVTFKKDGGWADLQISSKYNNPMSYNAATRRAYYYSAKGAGIV